MPAAGKQGGQDFYGDTLDVQTANINKDLSVGGTTTHYGPIVAPSVTVVGPNSPYAALLADGVTATPAGWEMATQLVSAKDPYHGLAYGIKPDGAFVSDVVMNGTTAVATSASNGFVGAVAGMLLVVPGAGAAGGPLITTIASVQSTGQVTAAAASQTAVSGGAGGQTTFGTNNQAALVALNAILPSGAKVIIPWGYTLYSGVFMGGITKSMDLVGLGVQELRTAATTDYPSVAPYLSGSVLVQCAAATDAIQLTGSNITVNRRNFGVKFADGIAFLNTGNGITSLATAVDGGGKPRGCDFASRIDSIVVFGHDGNHYGFAITNPVEITSSHLHAYGGGILYMEANSSVYNYGNAVFVHPYGLLLCSGTADGYTLKGTSVLNLMSFLRPQCNVENGNIAFPGRGIVDPTGTAQNIWQHIGTVTRVSLRDPDLEGPSNPVNFGGSGATGVQINGGLISTSAVTGGYPATTFPGAVTINGSLLVNQVNVSAASLFLDYGKQVWIKDAGAVARNAIQLADTHLYVGDNAGYAGGIVFGSGAGNHALTLLGNGDVKMTRGAAMWGVAAVASQPTAITAPTAPSAAYVQAEAASMKTAVDAIRVALTGCGLTA